MRFNGWTWLISGLIITIMSGYIYLFIPKNGQPNVAMALFFFIGVLFLIIGVIQIFFKRKDDLSVMNSIAKEPIEQKIVTMQTIENRPNKVELAIEQELQKRSQELQPGQNMQTAGHAPNHQTHHASQHTNTFSHMYQYNGPVHTPSTGTHAQHPVGQHLQQHPNAVHNTPHHAQHPSETQTTEHHPVHNMTEHSIKCGKCGNVNPGHSNYCHGCGNRLK